MIGEVVVAALRVAHEVIVVDSGSTDGTVEIAERAGARVIHQEWLGNGHQKRVGEDACIHDWLLDLDADEVITPAFANEVAALFADGEPAVHVYRTPLALVPPVGQPWLRFGLQSRHKLYDRRVMRAPADDIWDQFELGDAHNIGRLESPILHHAFAGAGQFIDKVNQHSTTRANALAPRSGVYLALRIVLGLPFYFAKKYVLQGYWRGGIYGFAVAMISAQGRWFRDVKMWEQKR